MTERQIISMKKEKTIDMSQYRYYPEDKKKLELDELIWKMWDFRLLFILSIPVWAIWSISTSGILYICYTYGATMTEWVVFSLIIFISFMIPLGVMVVPIFIAKIMDEKKRIMKNTYQYLSNVGDDFLEQLQADLYKGLPFMKKHNLVISDSYVIGSITGMILNPIAIPKEQIKEIAYAYYTRATIKYYIVVQEVYFRLKNGKEIMMPVGDQDNLGLTLRALEDCGTPIIDISQEKKNSRRGK